GPLRAPRPAWVWPAQERCRGVAAGLERTQFPRVRAPGALRQASQAYFAWYTSTSNFKRFDSARRPLSNDIAQLRLVAAADPPAAGRLEQRQILGHHRGVDRRAAARDAEMQPVGRACQPAALMHRHALNLEAVDLQLIAGIQMGRETAQLPDRLPQPGQVRALGGRRKERLDRAEVAPVDPGRGRIRGLLDGLANIT